MLDEPSLQFLAGMAASGAPPLNELPVDEARLAMDALSGLLPPAPSLARVEEHTLAGSDGGTFPVRLLSPEDPSALVVYLHGGGWTVGSIDGYDALGRTLADRAGCAVLMVGYRKAPENPYPGPVEDAWTALLWAADLAASMGVPLVVAGDSAGGNLAAVVAGRAAAHGVALAMQVLVYPVVDCRNDRASYADPANQLLLTAEAGAWFWDHYCPPDRRSEPEASPLRSPDLARLPRTLLLIAEHDPLRDENEEYAALLEQAGVPVESHLLEGQMHAFFPMVGALPGSEGAVGLIAVALARLPQSQDVMRTEPVVAPSA